MAANLTSITRTEVGRPGWEVAKGTAASSTDWFDSSIAQIDHVIFSNETTAQDGTISGISGNRITFAGINSSDVIHMIIIGKL